MANGYVGKDVSRKVDMQKKNKTSDLYMKDGKPCGDMEATGPSGKGPSGAGSGPRVGGTEMAAKNKFTNGIPNEGRESILAEKMTPAHEANKKDSVLDTWEDPTWGGKIMPQPMGTHNTFGVS